MLSDQSRSRLAGLAMTALVTVVLCAPDRANAACGDCAAATQAVYRSAEVTQALIQDSTTAIIDNTTAQITAQTISIITGLQGAAGQISSNIRGALTAQGALEEAKSNQDTQRLIQGDRVDAALRHQYSTLLCQTATGTSQAIAMQVESVPVAVARAKANAAQTAGGSGTVSQVLDAVKERRPLFCAAGDPTCRTDGNVDGQNSLHMDKNVCTRVAKPLTGMGDVLARCSIGDLHVQTFRAA